MAGNAGTKVGHGLAKVLGIQLNYREHGNDSAGAASTTRGESIFSLDSADTYVEEEPTTWDWITEHIPSGRAWLLYLKSLFPFLNWIMHYNVQWLIGDLVAGVPSLLPKSPLRARD